MRALVAVTCFLVIAMISYLVVNEYAATVKAKRAQERAAALLVIQKLEHMTAEAKRTEAYFDAKSRKIINQFASDGGCMMLAKKLVMNQGALDKVEMTHARGCYELGDLTDYERGLFKDYPTKLKWTIKK